MTGCVAVAWVPSLLDFFSIPCAPFSQMEQDIYPISTFPLSQTKDTWDIWWIWSFPCFSGRKFCWHFSHFSVRISHLQISLPYHPYDYFLLDTNTDTDICILVLHCICVDPPGWRFHKYDLNIFLVYIAVHNTSISDLVTEWVIELLAAWFSRFHSTLE